MLLDKMPKQKEIEMEKTNQVDLVKEGSNPAAMIELAVEKGANLEQLEKLLTLRERYEANEAKKAYVRAMTEFKTESPKVTKDKNNKQYNSKYTSLSNLVNTVNPVLSKHGLSASWDIEQNGIIRVTCRITHELGHSETASASAPADESGAKNKIQQIKSTITYLKAVTFESICGLASSDANLDDDANGAGKPVEYITQTEGNVILDLLMPLPKGAEGKFLKLMGVDAIEHILKSDYDKAIKALKAVQPKGKKE